MLNEFITDCSENLEEFENGVLELESNPKAPGVLDSMFRMIHSIKGASGFMAFSNLETLTHKAENVLDLLRNDKGTVDKSLISTFLSVCDAMKTMFSTIQGTGNDGTDTHDELVKKLLAYEESFKTGAPLTAANIPASPKIEESPNTSNSTPSESLDPLQIEMLKALGQYDENQDMQSHKTLSKKLLWQTKMILRILAVTNSLD